MIKMQNVRKVYPGFDFELSMEIPEGRITGLIGKIGAGKSTALSRSRVRRRDFCFLPEIFSTILLKNRPFFLYNSRTHSGHCKTYMYPYIAVLDSLAGYNVPAHHKNCLHILCIGSRLTVFQLSSVSRYFFGLLY